MAGAQTLVPQLHEATEMLKPKPASGHNKLHPGGSSLDPPTHTHLTPVELDHSQDEEFKVPDLPAYCCYTPT